MVVIWFNSSRLNNVIENLLQGRQRKGNARRRWRSFSGKIEEMMCKHTHQKKKKYKLICHQVTMIDRRQRGSYLFICFDLEGWGDQSLRAFHIWTWEEIQVACPVGKRAFSERPNSHEQSERRGEDPSVRYHVPRDVHLRNQNPDWNFRLFPFSHFSTDTQQSNPIKLFFSDLLINSDKKKKTFSFSTDGYF